MSVVQPANNQDLARSDESMQYRSFGSTGLKVSALSFGCMRLGEDQEQNTELISSAIDYGVNYFETTRRYIQGTCQHKTAPGLEGRKNEVIVSGKEGMGPDTTQYSFRREIERQLDILGLSHFKFFQVGWFSWKSVRQLLKPGGVWDALRQAKKEGLVQHVGFTGHDTPENFIKCIETGLFDSLTVPYNLINRSYESTIKRAGELGIGVVAMCPVAGGVLSTESSRLKEALDMDLPTTEMALRFVLSNPNVSTACSGMQTMHHLKQNVKTVNDCDAESGDKFEAMCEGLDQLRAELGDKFCTGCQYCMPCPEGINIPKLMSIYRKWKVYGLKEHARNAYAQIPESENHLVCTECGRCVEECPNDLNVPEILKELEQL